MNILYIRINEDGDIIYVSSKKTDNTYKIITDYSVNQVVLVNNYKLKEGFSINGSSIDGEIVKKSISIEVLPKDLSINVGNIAYVSVTINNSNIQKSNYIVSDPAIITVFYDSVANIYNIKGIKTGVVDVTFRAVADSSALQTITITVI